MFKNYFKVAWRNFRKNKLTTLINIFGLSIGISAALIIYLFIQFNFSFDTYERDKERIYRVVTENQENKNPGVPVPLFVAIQKNIPGIEKTAAIFRYAGNVKISILHPDNRPAKELKNQGNIVFANKNYFDLFQHKWLAGSPSTSLDEPHQLVLSESLAGLYFPGIPVEQLIGKTIIFNDSIPTVISGIVKDLEVNSDFDYKAFISLSTIPAGNLKKSYAWDDWNTISSNSQIMVKLSPGTNPTRINRQLAAVVKVYGKDDNATKNIYQLQPLNDIHTNTAFDGKINKSAMSSLVLVVIFLLLLGAVNFINLSTAQGGQRAKEIGIRKTFGGGRRQIILQFLTETLLLIILTTILSAVLISVMLQSFFPEGLQPERILNLPSVIIFLVLLIFSVSMLAGFYPAFVLSAFKPVSVLKDQAFSGSGTTRSAWLRKSLIIFQFVIAQVFTIGVIVVNKQIHYGMQKDMGFRKDAIINIDMPLDNSGDASKRFVFRDELRKIPSIQNVSMGGRSPAFSGQMTNKILYKEKGHNLELNVDIRSGDSSYLGVYHIALRAGRNVMPSDSATELIINETLARQLGFQRASDAVGHYVYLDYNLLPVVGVMADFNQASVRTSIHPLVFYSDLRSANVMHVALQQNPGSWKKAIAAIQTTWKGLYADRDFDYSFLDATIKRFYAQDQMISGLLTFCAIVAIIISSMGLLGLVIFLTNKRTHEIGIRKVLGASVINIFTLLSLDFIKPILLAVAIAIPFAWLGTNAYLQGFAYKTALSWWIFLAGGIVILTIAFAILSVRTLKTARANPVKSLRTE
jgi:putative ABC transport system permease protein